LAPYDEITDRRTAELHETILLTLNKWGSIYDLDSDSTILEYYKNLDFYNETITKTELLIARNKGVEKNEIVTKQLHGLYENLDLLQETHKEDIILLPDDLKSFKTIFSVQLGAIQKFQQVRKEKRKPPKN
jgi:hypothetical protein